MSTYDVSYAITCPKLAIVHDSNKSILAQKGQESPARRDLDPVLFVFCSLRATLAVSSINDTLTSSRQQHDLHERTFCSVIYVQMTKIGTS